MKAHRAFGPRFLPIILPLLGTACGSDATTDGDPGGATTTDVGGSQISSGGASAGGSPSTGGSALGGSTARGGAPTGGSPPTTGGTNPGVGGTNPGVGGTNPGVGGTNPGVGGTNPGVGGTNPGVGGTNPGVGGAGGLNPVTGGADPGVGGTNPDAGGTNPGTGGLDPNVGGTDPGTGGTAGQAGELAGGSGGDAAGGAAAGGATDEEWLPSWGTTCQKTEDRNLPPPLAGKTLRQFLWPTYPGSQIRVELSNIKGTAPVVITKVHIAMAGASGSAIDAGTDAEFTFSGSAGVSIPAGETAWSDALDFDLQEMQLTAISIHFTSVPNEITGHPGARTTSYVADGDVVSEASISGETRERWYFLNTIEVMAPADAFAVCLLGDSITDGYGVDAANNRFERWSDFLTIAINEDPTVRGKVSVINAGMGANSLLSSGEQDAGTIRFVRDCVGRPKVKWDIILEGVNDIKSSTNMDLVGRITDAYQDMIDQGREAGHKVFGSPITPFGTNADYAGGSAKQIRNDINDWVREGTHFDAVVDLAQAVADPGNPDNLLSNYSNDGLHPSIAGYEAMGNAVPLTLFTE